MSRFRRQLMMGAGQTPIPPIPPEPPTPDPYTLVYYWEAFDGLTNSTWVDRINGNILTKNGSPTLTTIDENVYFILNFSNYFTLNPNSSTNGISLGDQWKIELHCLDYAVTDGKTNVHIDFGSQSTTNHAFGFLHNVSSNWSFNTKFISNSTASSYNPTLVGENNYGVLKVVTLGVERYDDTQNIAFSQINNGEKTYGANPVTRAGATFNKNFSSSTFYVGRGAGASSAQSANTKYIKALKMYRVTT